MDNPRLHLLPDYAFPRLATLLEGLAPGAEPIPFSLGEPQHPYPAFVAEILDRGRADYGRYPPIAGTAELRAAITDWLTWRYELPAGAGVTPCIHLIHRDPNIYPDPDRFIPERFLDNPPGTYTWIPFGGGIRRCLGASFALYELKIVIPAILRAVQLRAAGTELVPADP